MLRRFVLLFAILDYQYVVIKRFDEVVLFELGVVEIDKVLEMVVEKYGIGHVEFVTDFTKPNFVIAPAHFERRVIEDIFLNFVVGDESCPNLHTSILR